MTRIVPRFIWKVAAAGSAILSMLMLLLGWVEGLYGSWVFWVFFGFIGSYPIASVAGFYFAVLIIERIDQ